MPHWGFAQMSVTDDVRTPGPPAGGSSADRYGEPNFDRTPPQDIAAEQSVLGGMLLSKDAIADVVEILRSGDFYRPAHAVVFDTILDLYGRGEPADPITVAAALAGSGELSRVGGAAYLHTLISSVPTAANSAYYARIVSERAVLRRLVEAGTRIVQMGYGAAAGQGRDVDDLVDLAQQAVYDVTERRISEDFAILADLLQPALDEIEAVGTRDGVMVGVPTGFGDLDRLLNGLHPGQLIVVAGRPGLGKALALDTPLPTPGGWTTMGRVSAGDTLLGADGRPTQVLATSAVVTDRPCYEVEFDDGSVIVADAEHQWAIASTRHRAPASVVTTEQLEVRVRGRSGLRPAVATARCLELPHQALLVAPYALGVWLASADSASSRFAGSRSARSRFTTPDPEVVAYVEADGCDGYVAPHDGVGSYSVASRPSRGPAVGRALRALGVLGTKHIPPAYLRASAPQRRALLAGLLDVGATVTAAGSVRLTVRSARLADDVRELIVSLGHRCVRTGRAVPARRPGDARTVTFATCDDVFRLERKQLLHKERRGGGIAGRRAVVDVRRVDSVPVRCVSVDNADHLYLAGHAMIPTHNSTAAMDFARTASVRHNLASAIFSLEMSKIEIVTRLLAAEARVPLHVLRSGALSDDDWTRLARRMGEISEAPIFVDDTPNMTLMEVRAKARRLRQRHDLRLIVVDYLQLMTSPKRVESRQQEVAELSRGLKLLAKEIECPVVAVSQLNRGPEQRTDKRPQLADLRESGSIEQDADVVILLHRDDYYDRESPRAGEADFIVAKHRNGPTDTVTVAAQLHFSRFVDMAI
jgi:replicative DNA helicase